MKCCGTCKWRANDAKWAVCLWPVPLLASSIIKLDHEAMRAKDGRSCPVWEQKAEAPNV